MRKAVGRCIYVVMICLCVFTLGFFAGQNSVNSAQITVIDAPALAVLPAAEPTENNNALDVKVSETVEHVEQVISVGEAKPLLIDINTADADTLDLLPGIGPAYAQRIIEYRSANGPFRTVEDIMDVSGIGEKTFAKMKDLITAGG